MNNPTNITKDQILEEHYPLLLKVLSCNTDGIWEWDIRTNQVTWALPIYTLFKINPNHKNIDFEFIQEKVIFSEDRQKHLEAVEKCKTVGEFCIEMRCICGDDTMIWVESKGCCLYDHCGKPIKMMGTFTDITAQKKAEEEVTHLSLAVENAMTGISWLDSQGIFQMVREGYAGLLGYSPAELIGHSWEKTVPEEHRPIAAQSYVEMLDTGRAETEVMAIRKDGSLFYKHLLLVKTFDKSGKHTGHYCFMRDIDERKGFEQAIQDQNAELKQINHELDNFVYRVSHDLRAPISSALGLVELSLASEDLGEIKRFLNLQETSLNKLDCFIKDILDYSRNSRKELDLAEVDVAKLIDEALLLNEAYREQVNRTVRIKQDAPFISDSMRLRVLLNNLISNAFKFSKTNYGHKAVVNIDIQVNQQQVLIEISDNGIGIADEHKAHVFEMFYRGTAYKPGSGIGLYITQEAVKKLQGIISFKSELDQGTTFYVVIPNQLVHSTS